MVDHLGLGRQHHPIDLVLVLDDDHEQIRAGYTLRKVRLIQQAARVRVSFAREPWTLVSTTTTPTPLTLPWPVAVVRRRSHRPWWTSPAASRTGSISYHTARTRSPSWSPSAGWSTPPPRPRVSFSVWMGAYRRSHRTHLKPQDKFSFSIFFWYPFSRYWSITYVQSSPDWVYRAPKSQTGIAWWRSRQSTTWGRAWTPSLAASGRKKGKH